MAGEGGGLLAGAATLTDAVDWVYCILIKWRDGDARAQSLTTQSLAGSGSFVLLEKCKSGIGGLKSIQCVIEDKFHFDVGVNIWLQNVSKVSTTLDKKISAACATTRFCKEG